MRSLLGTSYTCSPFTYMSHNFLPKVSAGSCTRVGTRDLPQVTLITRPHTKQQMLFFCFNFVHHVFCFVEHYELKILSKTTSLVQISDFWISKYKNSNEYVSPKLTSKEKCSQPQFYRYQNYTILGFLAACSCSQISNSKHVFQARTIYQYWASVILVTHIK